ncbi:SMP-30/gluconolactonase/LRE family protein [Aerosakkonema funiforme]|uniref:SMP-30/gluconolactonase/LRE family protein n=1 Tax=Aerosakkonema funiforme TaxID=1246630 RepID=UPI0018EFA907|nr:hypothetical protein [Aerosakkonema funiforme]
MARIICSSLSRISAKRSRDDRNQLPPIFEHSTEEIVPAKTIAEFPVNTFLENIAINAEGKFFITSYESGQIYQLTANGESSLLATIDGNAAGIALAPDGNLLVAGNNGKTPAVFRISRDGAIEILVTITDAIFLNGMTYLTGDRYLIADSYKGAIWEVNIAEKTANIWLQHERLARGNPKHPFPAVNGLKIYGNALYASNTQRQHLVRIPLLDNYAPVTPELFITNVNIDDFAFDASGNLYGTTHVYNSVVRISIDGKVTTIAKAEQGMTGSTALAFGRTESDRAAIYVTTNGGMSLPPTTGVGKALVVRLEVGIEGLVMQP